MLIIPSFQCLFCDGVERSHLPGGILTFNSPMYAHMAQMASLLQTKTSGPVTVFTDGVTENTEGMGEAFETLKVLGCKVEIDKIVQLIPASEPDVGVTVILQGGKEIFVGYLAHKPYTVIAGKDMIDSLGIEIEDHSLFGQNIKTADMFNSTNVKGVFVAGDAATPFKAVANALSSGRFLVINILHCSYL
jgi:hypothetical protein